MEHLIILGSSSFVGKNIIEHFTPTHTLHSFDSSSCNLLKKNSLKEALSEIDVKNSHVLFLSGLSRHDATDENDFNANVLMAEHVGEYFKDNSPKSLFFTSSACVYGAPPKMLPITEASEAAPYDNYGRSKLESEKILAEMLSHVPLTILRLPGIFGPHDNGKSIVGKFARCIRNGSVLSLSSQGLAKRDFLYVKDLMTIIASFIQKPCSGIFNICSGESLSLLQLAELISKTLKKEPRVSFDYDDGRGFDLVFDNKKLKHILGATNSLLFNTEKNITEYLQ